MKRCLSILLAILLAVPVAFSAGAEDAETGELRVMAYNVSGLPLIGDFQGNVVTSTFQRATLIGQLLNGTDVDIIGVEEDFTALARLAAEMTNYPFSAPISGWLTSGSGVNTYSAHRIFNVKREKWRLEFGNLSGSTDALASKGFVYCLMELAPGVYIDIIVCHCDAGFDPLSVSCRADNFRQMAEFINKNLDTSRALIVMGDLNYKFRRRLNDDLRGNLLEPTGLKDMWTELFNNGIYDTDDPEWKDGPGDDLDRILYRSGDRVTLEPISKTVPELLGENGERYTDHNPMLGLFRYTVVEREEDPGDLVEPEPANTALLVLREIMMSFVRVFQLIFGLLTELPYLVGQGVWLAFNGNMP